MGRPTKYKSEYCNLTRYIEHCITKKELPSIVGYAVYLDVAESTIVLWGKKHKAFSVSLGRLLTVEKQILMNKGLRSEYNSTITKLLLSANHGVIETTGQKLSGEVVMKPPEVK